MNYYFMISRIIGTNITLILIYSLFYSEKCLKTLIVLIAYYSVKEINHYRMLIIQD
jgi:hypothetical protein